MSDFAQDALKAILILFCIGLIFVIASQDNSVSGTNQDNTGCETDWQACTSKQDLLNNYANMSYISTVCANESEKLAKYQAKFPTFSFHAVSKHGTMANGKLWFIEDDAKFQNGFGAWKRKKVACHYNLRRDEVITVGTR